MNYIKEINGFHDRLLTIDLSVSARTLWYTFMHVNNKAGWTKEFSIAERLICALSGLSSSSFKRARKELTGEGFLLHRSRGAKAPVYVMVSLARNAAADEHVEAIPSGKDEVVKEQKQVYALEEAVEDVGEDGILETSDVANRVVDEVAIPLYKQKETKRNVNHTTTTTTTGSKSKSYYFYKAHFEHPNVYIEPEIMTWVKRLSDVIVVEAMIRALEHARLMWKYVEGVLENWVREGCETVKDVYLYEDAYRGGRGYR